MSDLQKLNNIIDSLEFQAKQVSEFSGVLKKVNDSSEKIDYSNQMLNEALKDVKYLLREYRSHFLNVEKRIDAFIEKSDQTKYSIDEISKKISDLEKSMSNNFRSEITTLSEKTNNLLKHTEESLTTSHALHASSIAALFIKLSIAQTAIIGAIIYFIFKN